MPQTPAGSKGLFSPRWSPDGRYIAAMSFDSTKLMLFDHTTQKWIEFARPSGGLAHPSWSSDGRYIYFSAESAYLRVRISDHKIEQVADLSQFKAARGIFSAWAGLTPDDSLLIDRDASIGEIYALRVRLP